jgi:hypothetical protein
MDPHIDSETGEATSSGRSSRFSVWTAFLVFSVVVLISAFQVVRSSFPKIRCFAEFCLHPPKTEIFRFWSPEK